MIRRRVLGLMAKGVDLGEDLISEVGGGGEVKLAQA